ncbi:MAG: SMP-30/gluconolactonase/LRE family protein [Opitutaceae bacterium]|nr:SMP-30/gluconolactonase/LRE family protein [Verrucomicrobiales bacterium]
MKSRCSRLFIGFGLLFLAINLQAQDLGGDMGLWKVLPDDSKWEVVADGFAFVDALCADAHGNLYFTDVSKGTNVFRIGADGKVVVAFGDAPKVSGLKWGGDGRLYACQGGLKRIIAFEPTGKISVIAEDVQPNDLVVSRKGFIYVTETGPKQITMIDPNGVKRVADVGISKPNGITLSPDQGTLMVSDYGGTNVWAFRVEADGTLSSKAPYMTMRSPVDKPDVAGGDGMTTDVAGRYYVTTAMGVQMFDETGRMGGVISKPQNKGIVSVAFAGPDLSWLYVASTDKVYRRKTKTKGVLFFQSLSGEKRE